MQAHFRPSNLHDVSAWVNSNNNPFLSFTVEVPTEQISDHSGADTETGQVRVLRVVSAQDVGKAINPMAVEGQMEGMVYMSMGFALTEDLRLNEKGRVLNPNFTDYKLLHATDMPDVEAIIVESEEPTGPFGAKGLAEGGLVPTAPAIANAIYDAVGVRIKEIPITSEKLFQKI